MAFLSNCAETGSGKNSSEQQWEHILEITEARVEKQDEKLGWGPKTREEKHTGKRIEYQVLQNSSEVKNLEWNVELGF